MKTRFVLLAVVVCLGLVGTAGAAGRSVAQAPERRLASYTAAAGADGVRVEVFAPDLLLANVFDGGGPIAQATLDGLGRSQAFASMPYPGETAVTAPGLLFPLVGLPSPPSYPLLAASSHPTVPASTVEAGAVTMSARSDERSSEASGSSGADAQGNAVGRILTAASVAAQEETAEVVSRAASTVEAVSIAGVLRIGRVHSSAEVVRRPAGNDVVESILEVEGLTVAGVTIGVTPQGFVLPGGTGAPVPDTSGLQPVLDAAGVSLEYLQPIEIDGGIIGAGLTVATRSSSAAGGTVTVTFGRAHAVANALTTLVSEVIDDSGPVTGPSTAGSPPLGGPAPSGVVAVPPPSSLGSGQVQSAVVPPATVPAATSAGLRLVSASSFYLVLVIGAAVALCGAVLVRFFGVKLAWTG